MIIDSCYRNYIQGGLFVALGLFLLLQSIQAQELTVQHDINWIHGVDSSSSLNPANLSWEVLQMSFHDGEVSIQEIPSNSMFRVTNATISDAYGNLVAYTNGCQVFNADYQVMGHGDSLNTGFSWNNLCTINRGYSVPQGALFLPDETDSSKYYLYHVENNTYESGDTFDLFLGPLYRSTVDLSTNNGLGQLWPKRQMMSEDKLQGILTAVRTADLSGWWIMSHLRESDIFVRYRQDPDTLLGPWYQSVGVESDLNSVSGGNGLFSPQGDRFAWISSQDGLNVLDFDRESGLLANPRTLHIPGQWNEFMWCAFASEGRFLYVNTLDSIWQIDTWEEDLAIGAELVAEYDGFVDVLSTTFFGATLAPDCRIYVNSANGNWWMHYIAHPNRKGLACDVKQHAINTPNLVFVALPNMVNYRLGVGPVCDSTIVLTSVENPITLPEDEKEKAILVWPNPGNDFLSMFLPVQGEGVVRVIDLQGRPVLAEMVKPLAIGMDINTSALSPGIYLIVLQQKGQPVRQVKWIKAK